jgi:dihydrofolate reductase
MGHVLLMGRRTYTSIGRPLPGRRSIVLTRDPTFRAPAGVTVAPGLDQALRIAGDVPYVFVIGGAEVYRTALARADELLVTRVHTRVPGDVRFPSVDWAEWTLVEEEDHPADDRHAFAFTFRRYTRRD